MITEFKSGIYTARFQNFDWHIKENDTIIGFIDKAGLLMYYVENINYHSTGELRVIADLMDLICKQDSQLNPIRPNAH